ncbi:DNA helicase INO80 [Carpediemonas membranifera]|uniref:Chromatin-remodeling ATPase INO80 n=1 Tax=Carpediemonas membranifera TaxID=201153 RepID=A0A8J6DXG5_9EUKA|nr:DNA helicase INO80 [Carpediemonas membranifera]|eukprot:KAG9390099.1 DNA helicase INO80 [Carpediemonas membranifera]
MNNPAPSMHAGAFETVDVRDFSAWIKRPTRSDNHMQRVQENTRVQAAIASNAFAPPSKLGKYSDWSTPNLSLPQQTLHRMMLAHLHETKRSNADNEQSIEDLAIDLKRQLVIFDDRARLPRLEFTVADGSATTYPDGRAGIKRPQKFPKTFMDSRTANTVPGASGTLLFNRPSVATMQRPSPEEDDNPASLLDSEMEFLAGTRLPLPGPSAPVDVEDIVAAMCPDAPGPDASFSQFVDADFLGLDPIGRPTPFTADPVAVLGTYEPVEIDGEVSIEASRSGLPPTVVMVFGVPRRVPASLHRLTVFDAEDIIACLGPVSEAAESVLAAIHALRQLCIYYTKVGAVKRRQKQSRRALERQRRAVHMRLIAQAARIVELRTVSAAQERGNALVLASEAAKEYKRRRKTEHPTISVLVSHTRLKRLARESAMFWKKFGKDLDTEAKAREKKEEEQRRKVEEEREKLRQKRKLAFLLSQTELYSHFMRGKSAPALLRDIDVDYDADEATFTAQAQSAAQASAHRAAASAMESINAFDRGIDLDVDTKSLTQPEMLAGTLKPYQLDGLRWLASLYDQGINGILADDMGLGKTFQSIAFLTHLVQRKGIWGPFLVITPNSTLHNWISEIGKFCPQLKARPYWGEKNDRTTIRKSWSVGALGNKDSPFHVVVTSYNFAVQDYKMLSPYSWQYMVLDEAQAIKSSSSQRWTTLLKYKCRNRLLLSGTPVQNNMQELWSLLHFCMPTLFDSSSEFDQWFSRDLEATAKKRYSMDPEMLQRLHQVLKPFMLRREKKDVEHELGKKTELTLRCPMTALQTRMTDRLQKTIGDSSKGSKGQEGILMNLVMQSRKVCNHPQLFGRRQPMPAFVFTMDDKNGVAGPNTSLSPSRRSPLVVNLPVVAHELYRQTELRQHWVRPPGLSVWAAMASSDVGRYALRHGGHTDVTLRGVGRGEFVQTTLPAVPAAWLVSEFVNDQTLVQPTVRQLHGDLAVMRHAATGMYLPAAVASPPRLVVSTCRQKTLLPLRMMYRRMPLALTPAVPLRWPNMGQLIAECGKMRLLDQLLRQRRDGKHRCLLYCQMTKMMDILEDYLAFRAYSFVRFDGSSSLEDRRDLVDDFQSNPDIFVFLLSTRAGGLGINLTAADTVIFYDSDWNPTVDSQAMDRCHRLGQTKQVTVYRLVTTGSVEEQVLDRAESKGVIQDLVMSGQRDETIKM